MSEDIKDIELEEEVDEEEVDEEQEEEKEEKENKSKEDKKAKSKSDKTFSQSQVNRMMTREKNQGRNAVLRELGIDPKDKNAIAAVKALIESQKTEEQKQAEKEKEQNEKMTEAEERATKAEAKAEAMILGVKPQYVEDVVTLALSKTSKDEEADLKTIIGEFKTKYPVWFGEDSKEDEKEKDKKKKGQRGTGSSVKTSKKDTDDNKGLGARLAAQRKGGSKKFSYWGNK